MAAVSGSTTQVPEMDPSEILSLLFSPMAMQSFVFPLINYLAGIAVLLYDVITFFIAMANGQGSTFKPLGTQMVQQFITGMCILILRGNYIIIHCMTRCVIVQ